MLRLSETERLFLTMMFTIILVGALYLNGAAELVYWLVGFLLIKHLSFAIWPKMWIFDPISAYITTRTPVLAIVLTQTFGVGSVALVVGDTTLFLFNLLPVVLNLVGQFRLRALVAKQPSYLYD